MVRSTDQRTTQIKTIEDDPPDVDSREFDLLKLHQELTSIFDKDNPSQNSTERFIRLVTRMTNATASGWYRIELPKEESDETSRRFDQPPLFFAQRKSASVEGLREQMNFAALDAVEQGSLRITQASEDSGLSIIAAPCILEGHAAHVLVQALRLGGQPTEAYALILQLVARLGVNGGSAHTDQIGSLPSLISGPAFSDNFDGALQALCDACCDNSDLVAFAAAKKSTGFSLRCANHGHVLPKDANRVNDITRAMLEAVKYKQALIIDKKDANITRAPLLYNALGSMQCSSLAFLPVKRCDSKLLAMIVVAGPSRPKLLELKNHFETYSPLLGEILKDKPRGIIGGWRAVLRRLLSTPPKQWLAGGAATLFIVSALMFPVKYRLEAPLVIEPVQKRIITAPFDGVIDQVFVEPGGEVTLGAKLLKLDDEELLLRRTQLVTDQKRALKQKDIELATGSAADVQILQFEIAELQAQIDLINHQLANLLVTAPLEGLVIVGDLKRREGASVTTGEALFEIAPLSVVIVEAAVPAAEIDHLEPGMQAEFRVTALPGKKLSGSISNIHLRSTIRESQHVFIAESSLENVDLKLKPGMVGHAKIATGKQPLGWVWFHRAWQKLIEMLFW